MYFHSDFKVRVNRKISLLKARSMVLLIFDFQFQFAHHLTSALTENYNALLPDKLFTDIKYD